MTQAILVLMLIKERLFLAQFLNVQGYVSLLNEYLFGQFSFSSFVLCQQFLASFK